MNNKETMNKLSLIISTINTHNQKLIKEWNKQPGTTDNIKKELKSISDLIVDFFTISNG